MIKEISEILMAAIAIACGLPRGWPDKTYKDM